MKYVRPEYYDDFRCVADECRHSCCVGWEIEIDPDSLERFYAIGGRLGKKLRDCIATEPEPHFILDRDERCPFLNESGLCELILERGEDVLSDICAEHPRFYNEFSARTEYGVGMCCEAATKLLLEHEGVVSLICEELGGGEEPGEERELFALRDDILRVLDESGNFMKGISDAARAAGTRPPQTDIYAWRDMLLGLERLDVSWTERLEGLRDIDMQRLETALDAPRYRRIAGYIIFRHFAATDSEKRGAVVCLACVAASIVCALDLCFGQDSEHLRMFSSEIEYSDVNVGLILDKFT